MSTLPPLDKVIVRFQSNLHSVDALMSFDDVILGFVLDKLKQIYHYQKAERYVPKEADIRAIYRQLELIREHKSLQIQYRAIFNQALVLIVSHFSAAARDLFRAAVRDAVANGYMQRKLQHEKLDLTVAQAVRSHQQLPSLVANTLLVRDGMSFQDMQSTQKAFRDFCGFAPERDANLNNIIVGQAFRHAIAHAGAVVDEKLASQLGDVTPRTVRPVLGIGDEILFKPEEVQEVGASMLAYLQSVAAGISALRPQS
jgi:hypothetical protein